ncbi:hypothetical protein ACH4M4_26420 [Streptomyces sp. NPDC017254]|uniref:hypothetical protein n=1 Tax=unclassified Streptomyces TaxID=2593676 RepID=UPI00379BD550
MTLKSVNALKPTQDAEEARHAKATRETRGRTTAPPAQPALAERNFASKSVPRHLARGAVGFGLIIGSIALVPFAGPAALLAAPLALVAFRGCPTCWMVGLAQTISRGRLERQCVDGVCVITKAHPPTKTAHR